MDPVTLGPDEYYVIGDNRMNSDQGRIRPRPNHGQNCFMKRAVQILWPWRSDRSGGLGSGLASSSQPGKSHPLAPELSGKNDFIQVRWRRAVQGLQRGKSRGIFYPDVEVEINLAGFEPISMRGRDEVVQSPWPPARDSTSMKVEFPGYERHVRPRWTNRQSEPDRQSRPCPASAIFPRRNLISMLKKVDGKWLINHVETVRTLSSAPPR